jgi:hypothetical protein
MIRSYTISRVPAIVLLAGVAASLGFNPASTAVQKVREGIRYFIGGEFESASKAFGEADKAEPDNSTIAFDRACALAASGDSEKVEEARQLFRDAALARDVGLAARAQYNLGCLSAEQGRATLGENPVEAAPEKREEGVSLLLAAVGHYRDCLRLDEEHADARHNLELIRLFIKHIQDQWAKLDREKAREEKGLLEFLAMIEQRQTELRASVRLLSEEQDSPQRRQAASELADTQTELRDEIEPLKGKIAEEITAAQQGPPGGNAANTDPDRASQMEQAQKVLHQLADEAASKMAEAASDVSTAAFEDARTKQLTSLDRLNDIFMAMAPFQNVLQRATRQQEQLTGVSETLTGYVPEAEAEGNDAPDDEESKPSTDEQEVEPPVDIDLPDHQYPEWALQQSRVADWSRMLSLKAQADLPQVEAQLQAAQEQAAATDDATQPPASKSGDDEKPDKHATPDSKSSAKDQMAQLAGLKASLEKAIELGPKVEDHSRAAVESLEVKQLVAALPDQQQALKLLREIAEPLKKNDQQQNGDDQKNDDQQDQDGEKGDQDQQSQNDQQEKSDQQKQQEQQQKGQSQRQRAMSTLRRAREREREHRDLQKQLQQLIGGRIRVDRDW